MDDLYHPPSQHDPRATASGPFFLRGSEIGRMFRVPCGRDLSCVRSCGREICLWWKGVFGSRVLLLFLRSAAPLVSRSFFFIFPIVFTMFFMFSIFPLPCAVESQPWLRRHVLSSRSLRFGLHAPNLLTSHLVSIPSFNS